MDPLALGQGGRAPAGNGFDGLDRNRNGDDDDDEDEGDAPVRRRRAKNVQMADDIPRVKDQTGEMVMANFEKFLEKCVPPVDYCWMHALTVRVFTASWRA